MKKLLYLLLCVGLCFGCSNTNDTTEVDDVEESENVEETVEETVEEVGNPVELSDEENENIQSLLVCMNYGDEDHAYIDNLFNYVFDSYYSFDGSNLAQVPEFDQRFMVVGGSIGYNVCEYYLESIGDIDIEDDLEKSEVASIDDYGEYVYLTINRTEEDTEFSFSDFTVRESQLGDDYYIVEYTISDDTNTYEDCSATIYKNAHSLFGYSIFEFNQDDNKDAFDVYDDIITSNTDITSISSDSDAQDYVAAYFEAQGVSCEVTYVESVDTSVFMNHYYVSFAVNDEYYDVAVIPDTGMIIQLGNDAKVGEDVVLVDMY